MAARSKPLAAQQKLPMPSSEDKAHPRNRKHLTRPRTSRAVKTSAIEKESATQTDNKRQEEPVVEGNSLRRNLRPRTGNRNQTNTSSAQKAATRKRSRTLEAEQAADLRRSKRPRKLVQQPLPVQQAGGRKRRLNISESGATGASRKRARHNPDKAAVDSSAEQEEADNVDGQKDPILYWTKTGHWPEGYSEQSDNDMSHLLARQKSSGSFRRKKSAMVSVDPASTTAPTSVAPSSTTPSDQKPREVKSAPYQDPRYKLLLATKGSFMEESDLDIIQQSKKSYLNLLDAKQTVPSESLFRDDLFKRTCQNIQDRNETRVIRDISLLIVPSAETLTTYGAGHLKILIESTNEGWNNSLPLTGTCPQPDFSVGFKREAFTKEQLDKLAPFIGNFISGDQSYFMATYYMYFPFLTCEVKCGATALDIADRQNAHSMTLAVRATVELFRLIGREMELHREILAFSISHDHRSVRIYGHYPVIDGKDTKYYRHLIREFSFTELDRPVNNQSIQYPIHIVLIAKRSSLGNQSQYIINYCQSTSRNHANRSKPQPWSHRHQQRKSQLTLLSVS
ncbi:hypothetical protein EJ06DRAFT_534422 [Trichodelitschia bisporula]|uniref:DUF7924 domain-containing protein n=1 Tax=Trichodelitschia bisporula TaxID=703511 RepID=A0A6G1HJE0_9PEZI|nr:hypothetical protein EJ06DRAFT_534422 [Trichodelitschia bisporula]